MFNFVYLKLAANIGNAYHNFIQETYGFQEKEKTIISESYKVKGRVDAVQGNHIYEIKPVDQDKIKEAYKKVHYDQAVMGAYILNRDYRYYIDTITLIYYIRDNFRKNPIAFDFAYNAARAEFLLTIAKTLHKCLQDNTVPSIKTDDKGLCSYCPYITYCENDKVEETYKDAQIMYDNKQDEQKKRKEAIFLF